MIECQCTCVISSVWRKTGENSGPVTAAMTSIGVSRHWAEETVSTPAIWTAKPPSDLWNFCILEVNALVRAFCSKIGETERRAND